VRFQLAAPVSEPAERLVTLQLVLADFVRGAAYQGWLVEAAQLREDRPAAVTARWQAGVL
jgi:hypothetical protein